MASEIESSSFLQSCIASKPAIPDGGTAFTSAATFSFFAIFKSSLDTSCIPAAPLARTTSTSET